MSSTDNSLNLLKIEALENDINRIVSIMLKSKEVLSFLKKLNKFARELKDKHYVKGVICGVKYNPEEIENWIPKEILRIASGSKVDKKILNPIIAEMNKCFLEREKRRIQDLENKFRGYRKVSSRKLSISTKRPLANQVLIESKENIPFIKNNSSEDFEAGLEFGVKKAISNYNSFSSRVNDQISKLLQEFRNSTALLKINGFIVQLF